MEGESTDVGRAVRAGMPVLQWRYPKPVPQYHRLVHERSALARLAPAIPFFGAASIIAPVAVANPSLGLLVTPITLALAAAVYFGHRAGVFERSDMELPAFHDEVLFTSTGVIFGSYGRRWKTLARADFISTDWFRVELEFHERHGHRTTMQIPVPAPLAPHARELTVWLCEMLAGRSVNPPMIASGEQ